ncbi:MAG: DUF6476 family protein, partial [Chloroflexota bacterium]
MEVNWKRSGLLYLAMLLGVVAIATVLFSTPQKPTQIPLSEAIAMSDDNNIKGMTEEGEWLTITTTDGRSVKADIGALNYNDLRQLGLNSNVPYEIKPLGINWGNIILGFLPLLLFGVLLFFMFFRAKGVNNQALSFGRSRARLSAPDKPSITFNDVAGVDEAKQELYEVVEFLKSREKFQAL